MFLCMHLLLSFIFRLLNIFPLLVMNFAPKLFTPLHCHNYLKFNHYLDQERCLFLLMLMLMLARWQELFKAQLVAMMVWVDFIIDLNHKSYLQDTN